MTLAASRGLAALVSAVFLMVSMDDAFARRSGAYVTAYSIFGHGRMTAPVRSAPLGWQVRLPGGTWIYCAGSCAETLRREKLDFWETLNDTIER